jgi:hypothetical protein
MQYTAKIAEFTTRARDELAMLANDNQPPEKAGKVQRLIQTVLGPQPPRQPIERGGDRPLNDAELCAVRRLIDYQADEFGVMARLITLAVEIAFEADDLMALRAAQFDAVMWYLVHLHERCVP